MCELTVLIVEDEPTQRMMMEKTLRYCRSLNVLSAASVDEAKQLLKEHRIDGAILDLVLARGSGLEVAALVRELEVPVFFVTSTDDAHNIHLMNEYGLVLSKPPTLPGLFRVLEFFDLAKYVREHRK